MRITCITITYVQLNSALERHSELVMNIPSYSRHVLVLVILFLTIYKKCVTRVNVF